MAITAQGRPVSSHQQAYAYRGQQATAPAAAPAAVTQPTVSPFTPSPRELHPGARNRLWLALKSGIDDEVDWSLPRLVLASFDRRDVFVLDQWVDPVPTLREWPTRWLEELEREAAYNELLRGGGSSTQALAALGAIPAWTRSPATELRASYCLQILRNASFLDRNVDTICRAKFDQFIIRFFSLPVDYLLEVATRSPEPFQHVLVILQSIFDKVQASPKALRILTEILPKIAMNTRDSAVIFLLLPLLIRTFGNPGSPPPPDGFIQYILFLLTANPPSPLLDLGLDLLAVMVPLPQYARVILADPSFPGFLKSLVLLLEHGARPESAKWAPPGPFRPIEVNNPASEVTISRLSSHNRRLEREQDKIRMDQGHPVLREVGDKQPVLPMAMQKELRAMSEPKRSMAWMHECFVYSSHAQLLQTTFWNAYREFFANPATREQLLSASEVIKNVQLAFPAAQAKLWKDERGESKFVIAGIGFRKGSADMDRFSCQWRGCPQRAGPTNPGELIQHIQQVHLGVPPSACGWGLCDHAPFSTAHLLTHLPLARAPVVPESLSVYASQPQNVLGSKILTNRPPPLLPMTEPLRFAAKMTETDGGRHPTGAAFLAALTIRGLARNLRTEIEAARPGEMGLSDAQRKEKKKHLAEERFGLPIPDSVLREEEEEEDEARGDAEAGMSDKERERARIAFRTVEERVLEVVNTNFAGLGLYLGDAFGW